MHPARSSSQPPHLVPLVAQLKGSAGRHVVAAEIDDVAGALACGGRGLASPSMRAISSGMLGIKDDVCKTDELDGRVDGVRAREQQRSERGCMAVAYSYQYGLEYHNAGLRTHSI